MSSGHAFFAPSSAPRVVLCPASLLATAGMPDNQSVDAAHGTAAHWLADKCLRNNEHTDKYAGCSINVRPDGYCSFQHAKNPPAVTDLVFEVDDEMVNAVQEYIDWCNDAPGQKYPECRVDISDWCPKEPEALEGVFIPREAFEPQGGTSDHAACSPGVLIITDLKYGKGVKVFALENYQGVLYALGFIKAWDWLYDFEKIVIRICQPRLDHKDEWVITRAEIEAIGQYILERFTLALSPDAPFQAGEKQCKFCKINGPCRAQTDYLSEIRALAFDAIEDPPFVVRDPNLLTYDEMVEAWCNHKFYQARFDAIERVILAADENGVEFDGVKVVEAKTHRQWSDEGKTVEALALDIPKKKLYTEPKLISPSQAEKLLPKAAKAIVSTLAYRPRGGPTIVDAKDPRPLYKVSIAEQANDAFDFVEDDPFA